MMGLWNELKEAQVRLVVEYVPTKLNPADPWSRLGCWGEGPVRPSAAWAGG